MYYYPVVPDPAPSAERAKRTRNPHPENRSGAGSRSAGEQDSDQDSKTQQRATTRRLLQDEWALEAATGAVGAERGGQPGIGTNYAYEARACEIQTEGRITTTRDSVQ